MIRKLYITTEPELFREAYNWDADAPRWRKDCEKAWGVHCLEDFMAQLGSDCRLNIGVFDGEELVGLIMLRLAARNIYDVDIAAKRGADIDVLEQGAKSLTAQMFLRHNMLETFTFTPTINRAIIGLLDRIGFKPDGITLLRGATHGRVIEWRRSSIRREDIVFNA